MAFDTQDDIEKILNVILEEALKTQPHTCEITLRECITDKISKVRLDMRSGSTFLQPTGKKYLENIFNNIPGAAPHIPHVVLGFNFKYGSNSNLQYSLVTYSWKSDKERAFITKFIGESIAELITNSQVHFINSDVTIFYNIITCTYRIKPNKDFLYTTTNINDILHYIEKEALELIQKGAID